MYFAMCFSCKNSLLAFSIRNRLDFERLCTWYYKVCPVIFVLNLNWLTISLSMHRLHRTHSANIFLFFQQWQLANIWENFFRNQLVGYANNTMELLVLVNVTLPSRYVYFIKIYFFHLDIEENSRMKSSAASSGAIQKLGVVQRVIIPRKPYGLSWISFSYNLTNT